MTGVLFKIPVTLWVTRTIEKMNKAGTIDIQSWSRFWLETYQELGGKSIDSGRKGCPLHAAYGLWRLGRIKGAGLPYQYDPIRFINQTYGKNAAYAVLALDLLEDGRAFRNIDDLWNQVKLLYRRTLNQDPANSQQGAITIALTLFEEDQIAYRNQVSKKPGFLGY
jgi:hypothetical protein